MHDRARATDLFLVDGVVGRVHDEPAAGGPEGLVGETHQTCVRGRAEGKAVVHGSCVREHESFTFGPVPRNRDPRREVQRLPEPQLFERAR